jgi:septum formation protein
MVVLHGQMLGKPTSLADARRILRLLSAKTHCVITGVGLVLVGNPPTGFAGDRTRVEHETTLVHFSPLTDAEIEDYLATGECLDKAGAYAIQGYASRFVQGIEGDYFNVMGLPVQRLYQMLREWGVVPTDTPASVGSARQLG